MKYDPNIHNRKSIRLRGYDYSQEGAYFITICTKDKELYFERYPSLKKNVARQWNKIPERYANVILDKFVIMPNHIHGIIIVGATLAVAQCENVGVIHAVTQHNKAGARHRAGARPAPTMVGEIFGTFTLCVYLAAECISVPENFEM